MGNSNEPRGHHYIPKLLLKHFIDDNGILYAFDKQRPELGVFPGSPKTLFLERDFNTISDQKGEKIFSVEKELSQIEVETDKIIIKIIDSTQEDKISHLNLQEKNTWDRFVHAMCQRTPEFREHVREFIESSEELFGEEYDRIAKEEGAHSHWDNFEKKEQERLQDNSLKTLPLIEQGPISKKPSTLLESLSNKKIRIAVIRAARKSFIIGSNPVVLIGEPDNERFENVEAAWLPIAHNILVGHCSESGFVNIREEGVRFFNETIFKQSDRIAGRSRELIESLSRPYRKKKA